MLPADTLDDVEAKTGMRPEEQGYASAGKWLRGGWTLGELGVHRETTLHLS